MQQNPPPQAPQPTQPPQAQQPLPPAPAAKSPRQLLIADLIEFGFDEKLVREAVQYTHDKQKAADIVLRFTEKGRKVSLSDLVGPYALEASPMMNDKQEDSPFRFKMIMVVNGDLKMGKGKICAQVGHAVLGAYLRMEDAARFDDVARAILDNWEYLGQAKIVVRVDNEKELLEIERKAQQIKINTYLVEDAGHTQIKEGSKTVLALGPVLGAMLDPLTSHLKLL